MFWCCWFVPVDLDATPGVLPKAPTRWEIWRPACGEAMPASLLSCMDFFICLQIHWGEKFFGEALRIEVKSPEPKARTCSEEPDPPPRDLVLGGGERPTKLESTCRQRKGPPGKYACTADPAKGHGPVSSHNGGRLS